MYDIEVCVPNKVSTGELLRRKPRTLEEGREAEMLYDRQLILSLGRLIGATNNNDEDVKLYEESLNTRFTK